MENKENDMNQKDMPQKDAARNDVRRNAAGQDEVTPNDARQNDADQKAARQSELSRADRDLLEGVAEMRAVGERLLRWAEKLERSVRERKRTVFAQDAAPAAEAAAVPAPVPEAPAAAASAPADADQEPPLTYEALRGALAFICAAGYSKEVKALIAGCGVSRLDQVPEEKWAELLAAAKGLAK